MNEYPHSGLHPDMDSLSAFAEGVLPEHERIRCVTHLAECAECREVVFLAQDPVVPAPITTPAPGFWKRWLTPVPMLSAAVAGILMLSVALIRIEQPPRTTATAARQPVEAIVPAPAERVMQPVAKRAPRRQQTARVPAVIRPDILPPPASNSASIIPAPSAPPALSDAPVAITGTVTDAAGSAVNGALVTARPLAGAADNKAITNTQGGFRFAGLPPGRYEVQVAAPGFIKEKKDVDVQPDKVARVDSALTLGSSAQSVEVTASAAILKTETATMADVQNKTVGQLVLSPRSTLGTLPRTVLPSKLAEVSTVAKGRITLAIDTAGTLFRSDNSGKTWKAITPSWTGKAVSLTTEGDNFRLTTDATANWFSPDGTTWIAR